MAPARLGRAQISSGAVSFTGVGTCIVDANQSGNSNWNAAAQVSQSIMVNKGTSVITVTSTAPSSAVVGGVTYTPTATATSGDTVVITSATTTVCTISSGVVRLYQGKHVHSELQRRRQLQLWCGHATDSELHGQ